MEDYRDFTTIDNINCLCAQEAEAQKRFRLCGCNGIVSLKKVLDENNCLHLFWVCHTAHNYDFLPLFANDTKLTGRTCQIIDTVDNNEFICLNRVCFITHATEKGFCVLKVEKLLYQEIVESFCHAQNMKVGKIYPATLRTVQTNQRITACWINETEDNIIIFPVDLRDSEMIDQMNINMLNHIAADDNSIIQARDVLYRVERSSTGKFHLAKHFMQIYSSQKATV